MKKLLSLIVVLGAVSICAAEVELDKCPCNNKPKPPVTAEVDDKCPCQNNKPKPPVQMEEVVATELPA